MKVFAIVLLHANDDVKKLVMENFEGAYEYHDRFFLVRTDDTVLSSEIAKSVRLRGDDRIEDSSGFVIQQRGAYSGYTSRDLWEWLSSVTDGDDECAQIYTHFRIPSHRRIPRAGPTGMATVDW